MLLEDTLELAEEPDNVGGFQVTRGLSNLGKPDAHHIPGRLIFVPGPFQMLYRSACGPVLSFDGGQLLDVNVAHGSPSNPSASVTNVASSHG
jgi:hypothetical protein